jgi:RimJ/RimL family protein N-acetyltransferase
MTIFAETPRLILRELIPTDAEGMFALDSDPEVHRYLGNQPVTTMEQVHAVIAMIRQQYMDHGIGRWAVVEKSTGDFVGWAGLKYVTDEVNSHVNYHDLGYRFIRKYWGRGYGTEAASASLKFGFDNKQLKTIYAAAQIENAGSNKILKKMGFLLKGTFFYHGSENNWYELSAQDWSSGQKGTMHVTQINKGL